MFPLWLRLRESPETLPLEVSYSEMSEMRFDTFTASSLLCLTELKAARPLSLQESIGEFSNVNFVFSYDWYCECIPGCCRAKCVDPSEFTSVVP